METVIEEILTELTACVRQVSTESLAPIRALIANSARIYVSGAGRSGLCMQALGMRLMQLGKNIHVVGATTTPSIASGDLLILGSGSGQTPSLLVIAEKARCQGAEILLFTTDANSPLAQLADQRVVIPAPSRNMAGDGHDFNSIQPMGTLFEQALLIVGDSLIVGLMQRMAIDAETMRARHANLE